MKYNTIKEYDENDNMIYSKNPCEIEQWWKYDDRGNVICYKNSDVFEEWKEYPVTI